MNEYEQMKEKEKNEFMRRYGAANSEFNSWKSKFEEAYDYCMPGRNKFNLTNIRNTSSSTNVNLYDNTAVDAVKLYASRLQKLATPINQDWMAVENNRLEKLKFKKDKLSTNEIQEKEMALDDLTDIFFHFWHKSGGADQLNTAFLDYSIGTAAISVNITNNKNKPYIIKAIPIFDIAIEEGASNTVDTVFKRHYISLKDIPLFFGEDANIPECVSSKAKPEDKFSVIEGVIYDEIEDVYNHMVVLRDSGDHILTESVYNTNPFIVTRSCVVAGEAYGRGEILDVMPDIKTINKSTELTLRAGEKAASEIFVMEDDSVNPNIGQKIVPDGLITTANPNGFKRLGSQANPQLLNLYIQERQHNIKKRLMADSIDRAKALSPEEIGAITNERMSDSASKFSRLENELIVPMVERIFDILEQHGHIKKGDFDKYKHQIKLTSPLAQIENLQRSQAYLQTISQIDNVLGQDKSELAYDKVAMAVEIGHNSNIDTKFIKSQDQIDEAIKEQQNAVNAQAISQGQK